MTGKVCIIAAVEFDPATWRLHFVLSNGYRDDFSLRHFPEAGSDPDALRDVRVCECGLTVMFPQKTNVLLEIELG